MKRKLLESFYMVSKYTLYGFTIVTLCINLLIAKDGKAQKYKSAREVYISLNLEKPDVLTVLNSIESKTDFVFLYDVKDMERNVRMEIPNQTMSVAEVLQIVSKNTPLRFRQVNNNIDIRKVKSIQKDTEPEMIVTQTINGTIVDENGEGLPGASVIVKGTSIGTVSDLNGSYTLEVPDDATTLIFSYVGYLTEEVPIAGKSVIDHQLTLDITSLNEVIVVGYGTQRKSDVTGSVASVEDYRLENVPNTNFTQALQGSVSGVYISNNSAGAEQGDVNIRIRGQNSIAANNEPLIVLDGVPFSGNISQINQNDIESIEVLKDVSSSAIYGTRGANGVILITTKKGAYGSGPTITYSGYVGVQSATNVPDVLTGQEFYDFKLDRLDAEDNPASVLTESEIENFEAGRFTDWIDLSTRTSIQQEHSVSISSGTEKTKFYVSGTYLDVEGIAKGDEFKRYNLRLNLEQSITDWLALGTNSRLGYIDRGGVAVNFNEAFFMNPLTTPFEEDGSLTVYPWPEDEFFSNPLANSVFTNEDEEYTVFSNIYLDLSFPFIPGLSYKLNTGFEYSNRDRNTYRGSNTKVGFEASGGVGTSTNRQDRNRNYLVENIITYKKSFGKHNLDFTGLYSSQSTDEQRFQLDAEGFPNDRLTFYQAELASLITPSNLYRKSTLVSQMGRINYGYDSKYLITVTARRDGFSGFGASEKYAFFPSVALGWNIAEESFLSNSSQVSSLKLRLSHGKIGNQAIRPFQTLARLSPQSYLGGDDGGSLAAGFIPSSLGDDGLGWETTTSSNIGVDYGFFGGRLQGSIDYYISDTEDLLLRRTISSVQGITNILQNIGETKNKGLEILLSGTIIDHDDFQWSADLNFSFNRNEIVDLYGDGQDDIANRWFIGQPINVNYGLGFDGIWQERDSTSAALYGAVPGDVRIKDVNGDTLITADDDREIFGNLQPDFIAGLGSTISYKNFSLNFFLYTEQGVERPNSLLGTEVFLDGVRTSGVKRDWWTPENPINSYPRNNEDSNTRNIAFVEDASFIRMRDVTLSYNFPESWLENLGLKNVRVYSTVRNLFTITDWTGTDPEWRGTTTSGFDRQFSIPLNRTFIFGINATLK
ncbi:TonB-dependent receptor [Fulvivirga sp. M361]|uniref:SusC/RagA family TonB-linked outer membrane protein n=1 Tax=Fulvivirga sp. M361 TaxID=2594266 RepID=UPI00117A02B3|nr:TonB-dependent receptor [Fulvivirga sp. M361]TRX58418.1 TonB-dependent receptor [Fulvivirga sp. M361]